MDERDGKSLWQDYRAAEPDPLTLAAYADRRLSAEEAASVERWLALHPDAAEDVAAARTAAAMPADDAAVARLVAKATPLVSGKVIRFRRRVVRWVEVSAIAASFALMAYLGFSVGLEQSATADDGIEILDTFSSSVGLLEGLQA